MATSSITSNVVIKSNKKAKKLISALEQAVAASKREGAGVNVKSKVH